MAPMKKHVAKRRKKNKKQWVLKFTLDCTHSVDNGSMNSANFEQFLQKSIKVRKDWFLGGGVVTIEGNKTKITIISGVHFSKRYLK